MPLIPIRSLVLIEWEDTRQHESAWEHLSNFTPAGICECSSVGFLIYDGEDFKTLAPSLADITSGNIQVSGVINIPTACIKRIVLLKENDHE